MPSPTTPFDPPAHAPNTADSGGDEVPYSREMVIGELLALEFDDDPPYTRSELDKMDDDDLIDLYNSEMFGADAPPDSDTELDDPDEEVECSVCGVTKVCDFEDEDGEPICADCEDEGDSEEVENADEIVESETDEEEEEDGEESSDDVDETEEA